MIDRTTFRFVWNEQEEGKDWVTDYRIYRKDASESGSLSDHRNILVDNTGSASTVFTDHIGVPGVTYEYGIAVRWDRLAGGVKGITTTTFARPW